VTIELVFIHGWGFDAHFWDALASKLPHHRQLRVDLEFIKKISGVTGKFSTVSVEKILENENRSILIGHSLGFVHGLQAGRNWAGWIAINSFPHFVAKENSPACVTAASLREMRMRLQKATENTLADFYKRIGAKPPPGTPNVERLREGLDELRDADVTETLQTLDVPGLVLAGRNDPLVPFAVSEKLGSMAKGGGLVVNEEGGHLLPQTASSWCALAIANFVTSCIDRA